MATQLYITDKAVSKWERGLSCPDIALLTSLADILGVTRMIYLMYSAILMLIFNPTTFLINLFLDITLGQGQTWTSTLSGLNALIPLAAAIILFTIDVVVQKNEAKRK